MAPRKKKTETDKEPTARPLPVPVAPKTIERLDPVTQYMREIARYPLLTPEQEEELAQKYIREGDKTSGQQLVLSNLRLVVKIALEYTKAFHNILDLIQEGNIGLMRAVEKFDPGRQVRFGSYAAWWIRAYILKYIIDNFRLVKVGTTQAQKKLFFNLVKEKEKIESLGVRATPKLLAERLDVKENEVEQMEVRMGGREVELDAPKAGFDSGSRLDDLVADQPELDDAIEKNELQEKLLENLDEFTKSLAEKEKKIFQTRLFAEIPVTLQDIADQYGISRERVRQIESRVLNKMRKFFKTKGLDVPTGDE